MAVPREPLLQFQADLLNTRVVRPRCIETTALGAAGFAGLAVGFWPDRDALVRNAAADATFQPRRPRAEIAALRSDWERALECAKGWSAPSSEM
jgi:glycerol kinase